MKRAGRHLERSPDGGRRILRGPRIRREARRRGDIVAAILQAARKLILSKGFTAMTMDDIAREACLCKATVYKYVPSKGRILFEIVSRFMDEENARIREIRDSETGGAEKLRAVIAETIRLRRPKSTIGSILMMDKVHFKLLRLIQEPDYKAGSRRLQKVLGVLRQKDLETIELVADIVREGTASGEFRSADPLETASFLYSLFDGIIQPRFWQRGLLDLPDDLLSERIYTFVHSSLQKRDFDSPERA